MALTQLSVDNSILEKEELDWAVIFLRQNRSGGLNGGLNGMRAEHLQSYLQSEIREDFSEPAQWGQVVSMIQAILRKVNLT